MSMNNDEVKNKNKLEKNITYKDNCIDNENLEDTTKYGEFISSYFNWITLDEQKKRAEELNKMSKD